MLEKKLFGERLSELSGIPKEVAMNLTKLAFSENRELYIENHRGIEAYTNEFLKIKTKYSVVKIIGTNFKISYINKYDVLVEGIFYSITFEHI